MRFEWKMATAWRVAATPPAVTASATLATASDTFAIRGTHVVLGDGQVVENGVVWVENGKIRAAGADVKLPDGTPLVEHEGYVTAGLVGFGSSDGLLGETHDSTRSLMPDARVADAVDLSNRGFEALRRAGITTVVLTPSEQSLVGGSTAVVKTAGNRMLARDAHLWLSFSSSALDRERFPTSYGAALAELDRQVEAGEGRVAQVAGGSLPVLMNVSARHQALRAAEWAKRHGARGAVMGGALTGELAAQIADANLAAIVEPLSPGQSRRSLDAVRALQQSSVPVAFAVSTPGNHPDRLRLTAAMCVREGLAPEAAWAMLTRDAAKIAGVEKSVGTIAAGRDADLVLWSGNPLELQSTVQAVYVDGVSAIGGGR